MNAPRLYDTRTRTVSELRPRDAGKVAIYACGPTVYARIHIGNARPFVVFSVLKRYLSALGYAVTLVANVTDVNDKIYTAASIQGRSSVELAGEMTRAYFEDTDRLGLGRPDHEPLASESIEAIVAYIETLIEAGHAYAIKGDVYFRVRSDERYGELSRREIDELDQGEGAVGVELKEDPADFALWKAQKADEDSAWDAPWGRGRPGWHIECSAMAEAILGVGFDIHGGGLDLLFPHHENEAAQTRCARGVELTARWMHNGMLQLGGEKMAKSVGNIAPLHEVLDLYGAPAVLLFFVSSHYRQPLAYGEDQLRQAQAGVARLREVARTLEEGPSPIELAPLRERFFAALEEDFNTPSALAAMWEWVREANRRGSGVGGQDLREMLAALALESLIEADRAAAPEHVIALARQRLQARERGAYDRADELRAEIERAGWSVRDVAGGFELLALS